MQHHYYSQIVQSEIIVLHSHNAPIFVVKILQILNWSSIAKLYVSVNREFENSLLMMAVWPVRPTISEVLRTPKSVLLKRFS